MLKRIGRSRHFQVAAGALAASYLRLVHRTSSFEIEPADAYDQVDANLPVILAMWHGQHFLMPFIKKPYHQARVLISRHRDGEINAQAAERLGIRTIRGSGDMKGRFHLKGGVPAFRAMIASLEEGVSVALTADVPKIARRAGLGIVKLAAYSGRPIVPVAIATSRRIEINSWDKTALNLPFARGAAVVGDWIRVPAEADETALETARRAVEQSLDAATARAYQIADGRNE